MSRTARAPGFAASFALIAFMHILPRVAGVRRTFAFARRVSGRTAAMNDVALTTACSERVALAAAFFPRRALCLEQSLALYIILRRRGIAAELKLGVQPRPFFAHAWVEVYGRPINEADDLPLNFATFATSGV